MDALTSFELEAQRRRETVASDRDTIWAHSMAAARSSERIEVRPGPVRAAVPARPAEGDCPPATLTRQSVG